VLGFEPELVSLPLEPLVVDEPRCLEWRDDEPPLPEVPLVSLPAPLVSLPVVPLVPVAPLEPVVPLVPLVPVAPLGPVEPLVPLVPVAPLVPVEPLVPVVPLVPVAPLVPVVPLVPVAPLVSPPVPVELGGCESLPMLPVPLLPVALPELPLVWPPPDPAVCASADEANTIGAVTAAILK
jgi:hypothetical protein